jgi:DNA-binding NtrC family response regulator
MANSRAEQLIFLGQFKQALEQLNNQLDRSLAERALTSWAELELGETEKARTASAKLLEQARDSRAKAYALMVYGKALGRSGSPEQALMQTRRAIELASTIDPTLEAEFLAQHVNCAFWSGIEPALAELPRLRQVALKTGNRNALVEYHLARARIAAFRNIHSVTTSEIRIREGLLTDHQNLDQLWRLREVQANLALMDSDLRAAWDYSEECLRMANEMGLRSRATYTRSNLAYIQAYTGAFDDAKRITIACVAELPALSRARLAMLSTGIHAGIASRDDAFAEAMVEEGLTTLKQIGDEQSYYRLWFEFQHVRWLLATNHAADALSETNKALVAVPRLADLQLLTWFHLAAVEAMIALDRLSDARSRFAEVCSSLTNPSLEILADLMRVAAIFASQTEPSTGVPYLERAHALLSSAGMHGLRAEMDRSRTLANLRYDSETNPKSVEFLLFRLGLLLRLGRHPLVLGHELVSLLSASSELETYLVAQKDGGRRIVNGSFEAGRNVTAERVSLDLGMDSKGNTYCLCARQPTSVAASLLWSSVTQVVTAALACQGRHPDFELKTESLFNEVPQHLGVVALADQSVELLKTTRKLAPSNITVLITGETGTGKELFARALHDSSPRSEKSFIPFNCSAVSKDMLDAQLFGYRKGAFTGAADAFQGVIRAAVGGTLFLDEIGEVALDVQPKLLRFLESGEIHPLGEPRPIAVDVRVVAATNANLEQMVEDGRFREDLFYRLNVVRLHVPPLRERREEIPPLVQHFLDKCSRESHKTGIRLADDTMEYLILFKWPGNVRQLANEIRRMVALAESNAVLMPEHLSQEIAASRRTIPASERFLAPTEFVVRMDQPMSAAIEHLERSMIQYALKLSGGRVEDAAERLGLSRKGLYLKRQRLALQEANAQSQDLASA